MSNPISIIFNCGYTRKDWLSKKSQQNLENLSIRKRTTFNNCLLSSTRTQTMIFARRAYCVGGSLKIMCVRPSVRRRRRPSVAIKNDQVLNGKSSLSKVNGSKRDPKRDQIDGLIARFWDVDEICGTKRNWRVIEEEWRISNETWRDDNRETHNRHFGRQCSACLI